MVEEEKTSEISNFASTCCFIALGISSLIAFALYLLPLIFPAFSANNLIIGILRIFLQIFVLIGLRFGAYSFAKGRGLFIKILTYFFVVVYTVAIAFSFIVSFSSN